MPGLLILSLAILMTAPLSSGSTGYWSLAAMETGCFVLLTLVLVGRRSNFLKPVGWLPLLLLTGFCLLQLLPLPPSLLSWLSPETAARYQESIWLIQPESWMPLSLHPKVTLMTFWRLFACAVFFLALIQILNSLRRLKLFVTALVAFGGLYAALGLVQYLFPSDRVFWFFIEWPERTAHHFATYVNGNHFAGLMGMIMPLGLALAVYGLPRKIYSGWREGLVEFFSNPDMASFAWVVLATLLMGTSIFFSLSRGGILASLAAITCFLLLFALLGPDRKRLVIPCLVMVLILGGVGLLGWEPVFERFSAVRTDTGELNTKRTDYWMDSMESVAAYPFFGTGFGTFADAYPRVQSVTTSKLVAHAHNDYVELVVEGGLVGAFLAVWFVLEVVVRSFLASRKRRNPLSFYLWLGATTGLVSVLLHGLTDFNLQIPANSLFFFALLALLISAAHTRSRKAGPRSELRDWKPSRMHLFVGPATLLILAVGLWYGFASAVAAYHLESTGPFTQNHLADEAFNAKLTNKITAGVALDPFSDRHRFALGQLAQSGAREGEAREYFTQALSLAPTSSLYLHRLAQALIADGETEAVAELLTSAALNDRTEPAHWKDLGNWYIARGEKKKALEAFKQVLGLRPLQTRPLLAHLIVQGFTDRELEQSIPDHPESHLQIAEYLHGVGSGDRAVVHLEEAMMLASGSEWERPLVFSRVADYYLRSQQVPLAFLVLKRGLQQYPENPAILWKLANLSERENLTYQAMSYYRKLLLYAPENKNARIRLQALGDNGNQ
ncbi:O-antigen ligase family protein [Deltaproteobacteria bacterium IMCC39524]|nr:O-antigen ligase family protein [Deltaproteobacteria bacterium IMCC39524]